MRKGSVVMRGTSLVAGFRCRCDGGRCFFNFFRHAKKRVSRSYSGLFDLYDKRVSRSRSPLLNLCGMKMSRKKGWRVRT